MFDIKHWCVTHGAVCVLGKGSNYMVLSDVRRGWHFIRSHTHIDLLVQERRNSRAAALYVKVPRRLLASTVSVFYACSRIILTLFQLVGTLCYPSLIWVCLKWSPMMTNITSVGSWHKAGVNQFGAARNHLSGQCKNKKTKNKKQKTTTTTRWHPASLFTK